MASRWIVVANSGAADIYSADSANARPELWRHLEHAGSRSKGSDLVSDRPALSVLPEGKAHLGRQILDVLKQHEIHATRLPEDARYECERATSQNPVARSCDQSMASGCDFRWK